jgi:hypothetical protein
MADPVSWMVIEQGWTVVDANGEEVGRVDDVLGDPDADIFNGLNVLTGIVGSPTYVPSEDVADIVDGRVSLSVARDALD